MGSSSRGLKGMLGSKTIPSCSLQNTGMTRITLPPKKRLQYEKPNILTWIIIFSSSQFIFLGIRQHWTLPDPKGLKRILCVGTGIRI